MRQLLELRYIMEKMRSLDGKLKHQIDRLLKLTQLDPEEARTAILRPNPDALLDDDDDDSVEQGVEENEDDEDNLDDESDDDYDDSEDEDDKKKKHQPKKQSKETSGSRSKDMNTSAGIYRAPKLSAVPYNLNETKEDKTLKKLEMKRKKLKNSEILDALREEFGDAPEVNIVHLITFDILCFKYYRYIFFFVWRLGCFFNRIASRHIRVEKVEGGRRRAKELRRGSHDSSDNDPQGEKVDQKASNLCQQAREYRRHWRHRRIRGA